MKYVWTRVRHGSLFRDPTRPELSIFWPDASWPDPSSRIFFGQLKRVFSDIKHFFGESIRTLSKLKRMESLSHLELLFVVCEVRHLSIYYDPTRPELENYFSDSTRPDPTISWPDPTRPDPSRSLLLAEIQLFWPKFSKNDFSQQRKENSKNTIA